LKIEIEKKKIQLRGFKRGHPDQPTFTGGIGLCFMWRGHEMAAASLLPDGGSTWGVLLSVETRAAVLDPVQNLHPKWTSSSRS
jgi:hypothetical protein